MITLPKGPVREVKFSFSTPPSDVAVSAEEKERMVGDLYVKAQNPQQPRLPEIWAAAREKFSSAAGHAQRQYDYHDNDFGAVGKYDQITAVGAMDIRERRPGLECRMTAAGQRVELPHRRWQKAEYAHTVTQFQVQDRVAASGALAYEQDYEQTLTAERFPKIAWGRTTEASPHKWTQVEVNYLDDTLIVRTGA